MSKTVYLKKGQYLKMVLSNVMGEETAEFKITEVVSVKGRSSLIRVRQTE